MTPCLLASCQQQQHDDTAITSSRDAHGYGASTALNRDLESKAPTTQSLMAYTNLKYEDVGDGIVGSVPTGTAVYQDTQRALAYQGTESNSPGRRLSRLDHTGAGGG